MLVEYHFGVSPVCMMCIGHAGGCSLYSPQFHTLDSKPVIQYYRCKTSLSVSGFLHALKVDKTLLFTGPTDACG